LGISERRLDILKKAHPDISDLIFSNYKFCGMGSYTHYLTGKKWTENPDLVSCDKCLERARKLGYTFTNLPMESDPMILSPESIKNVTKWIPSSCKVVVSSSGIHVVDAITKEETKAESIDQASVLIAEKCFKPFNPKNLMGNVPFLTKDIYDANGGKYFVQGVNINKETGKFNGLILSAASTNRLQNLTFVQLFKHGFHFEDGTPCGEYVKNRKPSEEETPSPMGIDIIDI
jgi:hypothetical protein